MLMENNLPINPDALAWLRGNIFGLDPSRQWVKIKVPAGMFFDMEQLAQIFHKEGSLFIQNKFRDEEFISGFIKDKTIYDIIASYYGHCDEGKGKPMHTIWCTRFSEAEINKMLKNMDPQEFERQYLQQPKDYGEDNRPNK